MSRKSEKFYIELLHGLRSGQEFRRYLNQIFAALEEPEARTIMINANIFGILRDQGISSLLNESKADVAAVKVLLCKERDLARHIAFELGEIWESSDYILINVHSEADSHGIHTQLFNPSSLFPSHPPKVLELLGYHQLILCELGKGSAEVLSTLHKQNIIPRLLFMIEKAPDSVNVGNLSLKQISQKLLNLLLSHVEIARSVCSKLDVFKWLLRIAKQDLYKARDTEMIEAISFLSFSDEFLPKTEEELIVSDWVYKALWMILVPENRDEEFLLINRGVTEAGYMKYLSFLAQILGNVSRSQGGMEEIIMAAEAYSVDVVWRIHHALAKFFIKDFTVWYTVLYLTNNMLRYPYYTPPVFASQVAVASYNIISNISDLLLTIACRAFRYLEFSPEDKATLCQIAVLRIKNKNHNLRAPKLLSNEAMDDRAIIKRNEAKMTKEWNLYFESKKKPWETLYSPAHTPESYQEPMQRYVFHMIENFKQFKLFFKKLPKPCEFCQDYYGPAFFADDSFWKLFNPDNSSRLNEISEHLPIVLIQFISVLCEDEDLGFIMSNISSKLNELLLVGEGAVEERIKCAIITLYVTWTELKSGFIHFYLSSGMLWFHQFYNALTLQSLTGAASAGFMCRWDSAASTFRLVSGKTDLVNGDVNLWRIHLLYHLLELLRTILRVASKSVRNAIKAQCIGLVDSNYMLITRLYLFIENDPRTRDIINAVISTTEEVSFVLIRMIPGLFYVIADTIFNNDDLIKIYIDMTGFLPSLLSLYAHISSFYLFISKDKTKKLSFKVISNYLETFAHSILKVFNNICTIIEGLEASDKPKPRDVEGQINEKLEKILLLKCTYYLLLSLLHIFENDPNTVEHIPALSYMRMYERIKKITLFAEKHFKYKSTDERNFEFPMNFKNRDLRMIPGNRNYFTVDFEDENEDKLFRLYFTSVLTWMWSLSQTENICVEIIVNPFTRDIFRICYEYEYWNISSYMALCSVIYNFTIMRTHTVLNCLPLAIPMIVKLISEMKIPVEGYLLLFQSVREIYPKIMTPAAIQQIHQIIAPLRTLLSTSNPVLKYFNYPLLKKVRSDEDPNAWVLEDETQMVEVFPRQLLNVLPIEYGKNRKMDDPFQNNLFEEYPGQLLMQSEAKSLIKMITPVTQEGVATTRNKIKIHVKAGQGHLLYYKPKNNSREERFSSMLGRAGSRVINSHLSIVDPELAVNEAFSSKVNDVYEKVLSGIFDRDHEFKY